MMKPSVYEMLIQFLLGSVFHLEVYILTNVAHGAADDANADPNGEWDEDEGQDWMKFKLYYSMWWTHIDRA